MQERLKACTVKLQGRAEIRVNRLFHTLQSQSVHQTNDLTIGLLILATDVSIELLHHATLINGQDATAIFEYYQLKFNEVLTETGTGD